MSQPAKILITSFQPFRGRAQNGSETIGEALAAQASPERLRHLKLPVVWGVIEKRVCPEIESYRPDLILGLGEGPPDCLRIETLAFNQRFEIDEENNQPPHEKIEPLGPDRIKSRWPVSKSFTDSKDPRVKVSSDAGRYLCNNALYRYALSPVPLAGFLHLPPQGDASCEKYCEQWLPFIKQMIEYASAQVAAG